VSSSGLNLAAETIGLIELAGSVGTELYLKLEAIGQLSADEQKNIHDQVINAIGLDQDTEARIAAWRVSVGLDKPQVGGSTGQPITPTEPQK
jgi:hypothetical protein